MPQQSTREARAWRLDTAEVRTAQDAEVLNFTGHAAVYGVRTWIGPPRWGWWEEIDQNAASDVLEDDAAFLVNHDPNILLARNPSTVDLSEDATGLRTDARWDAGDPEAQMWAGRVRRGDITQMSFAFEIGSDTWSETDDGSAEVRTIHSLRRLWDVSLVTYPAFPTTDAAMRSAGILDVLAAHRHVDPGMVRRAAAAGQLERALDEHAAGRSRYRRARTDLRALARRVQSRALSTADAATLQALLTQVAVADAVLDPIVEALEGADDALDMASATLASLLGVPNPDEDAAEDVAEGETLDLTAARAVSRSTSRRAARLLARHR